MQIRVASPCAVPPSRGCSWRYLWAAPPVPTPKLVANRIAAEVAQNSTLNGFEFKLHGKPITVNEIANLLQSSTDLAERQAVWAASKESGKALKAGLIKLRDLRNGVAQERDSPDYFAQQVAGYGMTTVEMIKLQDNFMRELRPLYRGYTRRETGPL